VTRRCLCARGARCFGFDRRRPKTGARSTRRYVQQAKPALVAELREAVANCDEELQKLKARAEARTWHARTCTLLARRR
jgi:hypothetical protein